MNSPKFLCRPIGLTQGQINIHSRKLINFMNPSHRSTCLVAFCYLHLKDPLQWTCETIDKIILNGGELIEHDFNEMTDDGNGSVTINVDKYVANMDVQAPSFMGILATNQFEMSLFKSLQHFFRTNEHCLFCCSNLVYLIWRKDSIYFVFDAQGRNDQCLLDQANGGASLICTSSLNDVTKLIKLYSSLESDECYSISVIKMKYIKEGVKRRFKLESRKIEAYTVLNNERAILRGNIHLGKPCFKTSRYRQAMPTALMALIYNNIQPSNSWTSAMVDKIILLGDQLFHKYDITEFEEITEEQHEYITEATRDDLFLKLKQALEGSSPTLILQVYSLAFAVWQNNGFYYFFDPYPRNAVGEVPDDNNSKSCVHMHSSIASLFSVMFNNLMNFAQNAKIELYKVDLSLECQCGEMVDRSNLKSINDIINELSSSAMDCYQELHDNEETCNLNQSSDDECELFRR